MEIDYDKDFEKVLTELQTNFGWSNIEALPDNYRDLLNDTIKAVKNCSIHDVSGMLPLTKEHQCFERGHAFYLVCEIDNGRSKYGEHKCSRCGHVEPFQYDYGSW